ncbi:MAG: acylphosphatase [Jiangellaceae bacterium]|nr:acylphosphatase [Jiangellaceae bacterium]
MVTTADDSEPVRLTARVRGRVQGVGFRWFARRVAQSLGLAGKAMNLPDGSVEVVAEGPRAACERFVDALRGPAAPGYVEAITAQWSTPDGMRGFRID